MTIEELFFQKVEKTKSELEDNLYKYFDELKKDAKGELIPFIAERVCEFLISKEKENIVESHLQDVLNKSCSILVDRFEETLKENIILDIKLTELTKEKEEIMAKLKAAKRNKLPKSDFGLPAERKYPVNDRAHAANAKSRATQMVKKGKLSASSASKIKAKANKVLGKKGK